MTTYPITKALPMNHKAFTVTAASSYREYVAAAPEQRQILQVRYAEVRFSPEQQNFLVNFPDVLNLVLVVSEDAPETAVILPILVRITEISPRLILRILRDTDDLTLLESAVDEIDFRDDELDFPVLLIFDEEWNWQAQWGPQPAAAESYLDQWLGEHSNYEELAVSEDLQDQEEYWFLTDQLLYDMRVWYNSALDQECISEICELLTSLSNDDEAAE
ncbi:MAG: thioredoxin family protein [Caldilineaceae bacterium]